MRVRRGVPLALLLCPVLSVSVAQAAPTITQSAAGSGPYMVARGSDSNVWFTDAPNPGRIGRVTQSGVVTTFTTGLANDGVPTDITAGPGGLWFTENNKDKIGRIATNGTITEFSDGAHNSPTGITAGPDGNLWYTATASGGAIARITPTGTVTEFTAGLTSNGSPQDITVGPDGNMWFTAPGTTRIGRITTAGAITQFGAGLLSGTPRYIAAGLDGNLWFTESGLSPAIGRITPAGVVTEFTTGLPFGSVPQGITAGADGNMYFTDSGANAIGRITPTGTITEFSSGLTASAGLRGITTGGDGRLWFAEFSVAKIGQMTVAPSASALSESAVTDTTATVSATVNPNSQATTYSFEWGTTTGYGQATSSTSAGSGAAAVPVSAPLTGLTPSTTYHARLVAVNATGTSYGPDHAFTTTAPGAPIATSLPATGITRTRATLSATVNPNNAATTYHFEFGTSPGPYTGLVPDTDADVGSDATDHTVSETLAGLAPNMTYHFRVVATSPSGTTYGDDQTFTLLPSAPVATLLPATGVTSTGATLNATVNPNNSPSTYHFEFGTTPGVYTDQAPVSDANAGADANDHAVTETLTGLAPNTTYHYRVVATSLSGTTTGADNFFTTTPAPVADPRPPAPTPPAGDVPNPDPGSPKPVLGQTAVATVAAGTVRFRPPGSATSVELSGAASIPSGSVIDTRNGTLILETVADTSGRTQAARFRGETFRMALSRRTVGMVDISLTQKPTRCPRAGAHAAKTRKPPITLWSKDKKGKYRTHGRNSVATVRGTEWTTTETCAGTLTRVIKGSVSVWDRRSEKRRVVTAGHTYLARPPR